MNHQLFESWLNSEEPLPVQQAKALQEHLLSCESCRALEASWREVRSLIKNAAPLAPAPGFAGRWQARLAVQQRKKHQKQTWIMLISTSGIAAILMVMLAVQVFGLFQSPDQLLMLWIYRLVSLLGVVELTEQIINSVLGPFLSAVPLPLWIGMTGVATLLSVLWLVAIKQLTAPRRMQNEAEN